MTEHANVELRKPANRWRKPTFRGKVREMQVGDSMVIRTELQDRNSDYYNAKAACPDCTFSVQKQHDGTFKLIRIL